MTDVFQPAHRAAAGAVKATVKSTARMEGTLEIGIAVAKVPKYAVAESGDTVEVTERPHGGLSVVLVDGQGSGRAAKALSNLVAKKAIALLADGIRDGATARAVHDFLFAYRRGQVSAELAVISADLVTRTLVVSRNTHCPAILVHDGTVDCWSEPASAIGLYPNTKPLIRELPIAAGTLAVVYSDGIEGAGVRRGLKLDTEAEVRRQAASGATAEMIAGALLDAALALDEHRPADDMSVAVVGVGPAKAKDGARRLVLHFPLT
ncbi:MAG: SpoIIE family protein phosphatase [Chloroflexi bacterium]|nr:SpoIIE family protein phosphatase [Chloroflexota bacterium]